MKGHAVDLTEFDASGVECSFSDGRDSMPIRSTQLESDQGVTWLAQNTDNDDWLEWPLRILSLRTTDIPKWMPFDQDAIHTVSPAKGLEYTTLWKTEGGGSAALFAAPVRFIAQTPRDGKAFCSMALTTTGFGLGLVRGIYVCTSAVYECSEILRGAKLQSGWRSSGWQILTLPLAFLSAHVTQKATEISQLSQRISDVENIVMQPRREGEDENEELDFGLCTRKLHECHSELLRLERRAHFESGLVKSIEALIAAAKKNRAYTESSESQLHLSKTMMEAQGYELEVIPKRIESQRTMIFNLIVQRDARLNLQIGKTNMEIADTSRRIAEASMRDSASMKTIAILTMLFLPGTAVASFFSMTMFHWEAGSGHSLVSSYIWIYFVVSVPLTLIVVAIWYFVLRIRRRTVRRYGIEPVARRDFPLATTEILDEGVVESHEFKCAAY